MATQTRSFKNTTKTDIDVLGLGVIAAGEQISVTGEYLPPVVLQNYPGLVETTDHEAPVKKEKTDE